MENSSTLTEICSYEAVLKISNLNIDRITFKARG